MMEPIGDTDAAWMQELARGEDSALNRLMDRWSEPLLRYLSRLTADADAAKDLAQESFVRVYRHRFDFRTSHKFSTWLFSIATNLARNHARWRSRHPVSLVDTDEGGDVAHAAADPTPDETMIAAERQRAVQRAIQALPHELREAVILSSYHDMTQAQIAKVQDTTEKAVEVRLYRARKMLRDLLADTLSENPRG